MHVELGREIAQSLPECVSISASTILSGTQPCAFARSPSHWRVEFGKSAGRFGERRLETEPRRGVKHRYRASYR